MNKKIYGAYSPDHDMTFIVEDTFDDNNEPVSVEVKGFYFGEPSDVDIDTFYGDLRADLNRQMPTKYEYEYQVHLNVKSIDILTDDDINKMVAKVNRDAEPLYTCECTLYEEV